MKEPRPLSARERLRQADARRARGARAPRSSRDAGRTAYTDDAADETASDAADRAADDAQRDALETSRRPSASASQGAPNNARRGGLLAVGLLALWKFKFVLLFLGSKLKVALVGLKLLKFGKLMTTGWTMILSMWVYSLYFGAPFAIGFVLLILIHELGHGLAARLTGLPVSAPVFIPFFGAMIALKKMPRDTFQDFVIGVGGPLLGSLGGLACLGAAQLLDGHWAQLLYVLAYFSLVVNMFNMIPVWQLDGARIAAPFRVSMWALAVGVLALLTFWISGETGELNPMALFIVLAGVYRLVRAWSQQRRDAQVDDGSALQKLSSAGRRAHAARDADVSDRQRWIAWGSYVGLAGTLIILVHSLRAGLPQVGE